MSGPLVTFHLNTERGWRGGEQQMAYLVEGLRERGHRVELVAQRGGEAASRLAARGFSCDGLAMHGEADPVAILRLAARLRRLRPDVVHLHTSHAHTLGALAAALAGRPVVIVSRRVDFSILRSRLSALKYRHGFDRIVCVSDAVRDVLRRDGVAERHLCVVRSAIDPARIRDAARVDVRARLGLPAGCPLVLAVGALVGHKGHRHLVAALPALAARVPGVRVVVAGSGPLRSELEAQARALGVLEAFVLAGQVDDLPGWFRDADVLAMPSTEEGLGTSVLDGMCVGLPVVASRAGGIPEMVRDGIEGLLVEVGDAEGLADALARVLADAALRERLGAAARRRVDEAFPVDRMVEETLAVYRACLAERGSRLSGARPRS